MRIKGQCHCGNLRYWLETNKNWEDITLRVCRCEFCLRHRPRYWSDPAGQLSVDVSNPAGLRLYRFGHGTADFVVCLGCGVFCFAVAQSEQGWVAVTNLNLALGRESILEEVFIEALEENESQRNARRAANWTPLVSTWPPGAE